MSKLLWQPSEERINQSNLYRFIRFVNDRFTLQLNNYAELYEWSVNNISDFWACMWDFAEIRYSKTYDRVLDQAETMPGNKWFEGARLNFAENLLRYRDDRVALIFKGESNPTVRITYADLYDEVARVAASLKAMGVATGDRVVGFMPNMPQSIIAMLAATSLGATWSSCSPDFGIKGVMDRFGQIAPKVLFTADGYWFKGKAMDSLQRISEIVKQLPSVEKMVVVPYTSENPDISAIDKAEMFDDFKSAESGLTIEFEQLPPDHPLYVMYSSGTTGLPKCMVQSSSGILINHMKELLLHTDLKRKM